MTTTSDHLVNLAFLVMQGWTPDAADAHLSGACDHALCFGTHR